MLLVLFQILLFCCVHSQTQFYLSPSGSDSNSGTAQQPWRTISRAQAGIKSLRPGGTGPLPGPVTVNLAPGGYSPVVFDSSDSGDPSSYVTYVGQNGAVISGGSVVTNWASLGSNLWKAKSPVQGYVRQLWVNGNRIPIAGTPIMYYVMEEKDPSGTSNWIQYKSGDFDPNWRNIQDIEIVLYHSWTASVHQIKSIDPSNNTIFLKNAAYSVWDEGASGSRYFLMNVYEKLQMQTFYYNSGDESIYYQAKAGEDPNEVQVVVSGSLEILSIKGTQNSKVQYLNFQNLQFSYSSVEVESCYSSHCDGQSATFLTTAAVHLTNAQHINLDKITISHVGGYGLWLDAGCNDNTVTHLHADDLGAGGVRIGVPAGGVVGAAALSVRNTVNDSVIENGGFFYEEGCGILLQGASFNTIAHNEIRYFRYTGVSIGWTWDYEPTSQRDNFVGFNEIHHLGEGYLSDMGCVYSLGISPGTQVINNLCHDVSSYNYGGWGLYTDQASSFITLKNNIVYNTKCAGIHQHFGENNVFTNNIVAFSADDPTAEPHCVAAVRSSQWAPGSGIGDHSSFTFEKNIVFITSGTLFLSVDKYGFNNMTFNNNVYWSSINGSNLLFPPTQKPITFQQWQAEGKDTNSVLADPQFQDPVNKNFNLKSSSPALKLGFVPIDTSNIGPRGNFEKWKSVVSIN